VAGIDINKEAIEIASQKELDFLLVADVENDKLPFKEKEFDCIIMADLLEHLYNPWDTLKRISRYLSDDGWILLSIPNVKNYHILIRLILHDEWTYSESGPLDNTHIRFFTLKEIKRLLEFAGLSIVKLRLNAPVGKKSRIFNALFFNRMMSFWVCQYYILAKKHFC
jgi:2-polyprenyl-3-methyl-5-hydroxy-6-metoxy-1,4-benzoquinol methylase